METRRGEAVRIALLLVMLCSPSVAVAQQVCPMPEQRNVTCIINGCQQTASVSRCAYWYNHSLDCRWEGDIVACCDGWVNDYGSGVCGGIYAWLVKPRSADGEIGYAAGQAPLDGLLGCSVRTNVVSGAVGSGQ